MAEDRLSVSFGWAHNQVRLRGDWGGANHAYVSDTQNARVFKITGA